MKVILDFNGLALRCFYSSISEGTIAGADSNNYPRWELGLKKLMDRYVIPLVGTPAHPNIAPIDIIAVLDKGTALRSAIYPKYHQKRKTSSERLDWVHSKQKEQLLKSAERLLKYMGVLFMYVEGQEADDVIAHITEGLRKDEAISIYTVDSDLIQLATLENVEVICRDIKYSIKGPATVYEDVPIQNLALYKALVGDTSDEYPGVGKLGEVRVKKLLSSLGVEASNELLNSILRFDSATIHDILNDHPFEGACITDDIEHSTRMANLAILHPTRILLSRDDKVVKLSHEARIPNADVVGEILSLVPGGARLTSMISHVFPVAQLITAENTQPLFSLAEDLKASSIVSYDFESFSDAPPEFLARFKNEDIVDVLSQKLTGISINYGFNQSKTIYVSINHFNTLNLTLEWATWLLQILASIDMPVVVHSAQFELTVAATNCGVIPEIAPYDTKVMSSYVQEDRFHNLKYLSKVDLGYTQQTYKEVVAGEHGKLNMSQLSAQHVLKYATDDSLVTSHLYRLYNIILRIENTFKFYVENHTQQALDSAELYRTGEMIDVPAIQETHAHDAALKESNIEKLRGLLKEHCDNKSKEREYADAVNLFNLYWEVAQHKVDGQSMARVEEKQVEVWRLAWIRSHYEDYTQVLTPPEFIPTASKINQIFTALGAPDLEFTATYSKKTLNDWLFAYEELLPTYSEEVRKFVELLVQAQDCISVKKRTGEAYDALVSFANYVYVTRGMGSKEISGDPLNFGSAPQMMDMFYGKLGLPVRKRGKKEEGSFRDTHGLLGAPASGNAAIDAAFAYDLRDTPEDLRVGEVLKLYKEITSITQNEELYYIPYPKWVHPYDGKVHPTIIECGTVTRRPSGTSPNKLQVSKKDSRIRKFFTPYSKDHCYICIDIVNEEVVVMACESGDETMLGAFTSTPRKDLHSLTASGFAHILLPRYGVPVNGPLTYEEFFESYSNPSSESIGAAFDLCRKYGKTTLFTVQYVGGARTVAERLNVPVELGQVFFDGLHATYPGIRPFQLRVIEEARTFGYVTTAYGNRRHLTDDLFSDDPMRRSRAERQAVNYKIQGVCADALNEMRTEIRRRKMVAKYHITTLSPIYDEMVACVKKEAVYDYIMEAREVMGITIPGYPIPLTTEVSVGATSWGVVKKLKEVSEDEVRKILDA